jgi:hypothetical protein
MVKDFRTRSVSELDRRATVEMMRFNKDQRTMVVALGAMTSWSEVQRCCRHTRDKGAVALNLGSELGRIVLTEDEFDAVYEHWVKHHLISMPPVNWGPPTGAAMPSGPGTPQ